MKKMKVFFMAVVLSVSMIGNVNITFASTNHEKTATGFSGEWENTVFYRAYSPLTMKNYNTAKMVYGYDTDFINEDYCWTYGYDQCTQASITNGNGTHAKSSANVGRWSKLEVRHKSADEGVTYRIWLENGYSSKYMVYGTDEK